MELKKRKLGKTNIEIGEVGIGLWAGGGASWGKTDDKETLAAIEKSLDMGVNFFDTADVYGHSEELLAKAMKGRRDKFIVSTKIGWVGFDATTQTTQYNTVDKLVKGVEGNLQRLQTDHVEIIFSHINFQDPTMPVFLEGFEKLQKEGKIRGYGVSTSNFDYLKTFNANGRCSVVQVDYSILNRTSEADILPYCVKENIGLVIRGALAMGILTGKFQKHSQFDEGDFRQNWQGNPAEHETFLKDLHKVDQLKHLEKGGRTLAQLALQFTLADPAVSVVIPGVKTPKQVVDNVMAGLLPPLTTEELKHIDAVVPPKGGRKIWPA